MGCRAMGCGALMALVTKPEGGARPISTARSRQIPMQVPMQIPMQVPMQVPMQIPPRIEVGSSRRAYWWAPSL